MLADPEEVHAGLLGKDPLVDHVADRLGMRKRFAVGVCVPVAEGVQPEGIRHARLLASWRTARSNSASGSTAPNTGPPGSSTRPARRPSRRTGHAGSGRTGWAGRGRGGPGGGPPPGARTARGSGPRGGLAGSWGWG